MKITATIHEIASDSATTWNSDFTYSLAVALEIASGRKPTIVMIVPISIGIAVTRKALTAARARVQPASRWLLIDSTTMIASSTSSPSATISAPSEMRCRSIP